MANFAIGGLVLALVMLTMALILLTPMFRDTPTIVTYQSPNSLDEQPDPQQRLTQHRSKPSVGAVWLCGPFPVVIANST